MPSRELIAPADAPRPSTWAKSVVAAVIALLLVVAGAVTAPAAFAAGPTLSATAAPRTGGTITVTGAGFTPAYPGVYVGFGPAGASGFYAGGSSDAVHVAVGNATGGGAGARTAPMNPDGSFSVTLTLPAFEDGVHYAVFTSKAHGQGLADTSQNSTAAVAWEAPAAVATSTTLTIDPAASSVAGTSFTLGATVTPTAPGTVTYFRGAEQIGQAAAGATITTSVATAGTVQLSAVFAPQDTAAFTGSTSASVAYEITAAAQPTPTVTVSKTTGLSRGGETLTIRGTGFVPNAPATSGTRPPLAGAFTGSYVVFGKFLDVWKPSAGATSAARKVLAQKWGVLEADLAKIGGTAAGGIVIAADGTFETTLTVSATDANDLLAGSYGIYTYPGGGATYAPFETFTPLAFAQPAPVPTVTVSKTTGIDPAGETVTVRGTGFVANAPATSGTRPPLAGTFAGAYVVFGSFLAEWKPSSGAPATARKAFDTKWGVHAAQMATIGGSSRGAIEIRPDGTFETTLAVSEATGALSGGAWGVYTYPGGGASYPAFETFTPVAFAGVDPVEPEPPVTPVTPEVPTGAGSLTWPISSSFSSYVTGSIAKGAIAVSGGATRAGSAFQFGQAAGSTFDAATRTGTVTYSGSVRFTGHGGILDVTVANPQVRITSASSAALYVTSGGTQVHFANLALGAAPSLAANGTVTYIGVPATLTAAGRSQVFQGNTTTLDPLTFTVGAVGAAPAGSTGTVATAATRTTSAIPSTPPATEGIDLDETTLAALSAGEGVEISVSGFTPNESGIKVVVYSTPVLLGEVTSDASGTATWSGSLPATLPDGEHTLTFQGSVDRGVRFTLARAAAAPDGCVVESASLRWGFKESFRTYIEGIAAGGWELADVVYEYPEFVWAGGAGAVDVASRTGLVAFGGTIRFTGHGGALDTTLAQARIELAGSTGYLVFDVTGTTQSGEAVEQSGVRLAEFALPDLEVTTEGLVLDALPATLTAAGAAAFGTYPAGEALDAVTAVLPTGDACGVASAPTQSEPVAAPESAPVVATESVPVWPWAVGGLALVLVAGAVVWIVV
ncbi:MAG: HtaA domain-containing protein, partial [Aeromicrobium sp.]